MIDPKKAFLDALAERVRGLGGEVLEQSGELIVTLGDELADELEAQGQELLTGLRDAVRSFGGEVRDLGTRGVAIRDISEVAEGAAKKVSDVEMTAVLSKQLFEIAQLWRGIGLLVEQRPEGLLFGTPIKEAKEAAPPAPPAAPADDADDVPSALDVAGGLLRLAARAVRVGVGVGLRAVNRSLRSLAGGAQ